MPSILDRLIDPTSAGTSWRRGYGIEQMAAAVQRDLEDLLNTRVSNPRLAESCSECRRSILAYGLPDLVSLQLVKKVARRHVTVVVPPASHSEKRCITMARSR